MSGSAALSQAPKALNYIIVPPDSGFKIGSGAWKLTSGLTGGSIAICEFNNKDTTDWNWVPSHVHTREDELWYVIEGELTFKVDNQLRAAGPGSLVFGPRNRMHSYRISKAPVKYLLILTPGGIDMLFAEVDSIGKGFPRGSAEFIKRISSLGEKYGAYYPAKWDSMINASPVKDELLAKRIELSKTGKNHELLAGITGSWNFTGKHFSDDPAGKPIEFKGTAVRKAIMDGRYFIFETKGGKLVMPWSDGKEVTYTDMAIEGYDNNKKKFVHAFIGNHWNTGIAISEGKYDSLKKAIVFESEIETAPGMKSVIRNLVKFVDGDHYTVEIYMVSNGREIKRSEINYTRTKINTPNKFHMMLARSEGMWTGKGTMQFSPGTLRVDAGTSMLINRMTKDGLYQISEVKGNTTPGMGDSWTGLRITGYDINRKVFTRAMIGDGNAAGGVAMEGQWDEATQSITMPFKKTDPSTGKERNLKEVYKIIDENTEVLEIYAIDEKTGKEFKMLFMAWTRMK